MVNKNLSKMWTNKHFKTPNLSRRHFILLVWLLLREEQESLIVVRQGGTGDQGQAMLLCLVSEDGDLSSSGSSISDEDRSRRRTNQRLIITIQMNVHSCMLHIQPELLGSSSTLPSSAALLQDTC